MLDCDVRLETSEYIHPGHATIEHAIQLERCLARHHSRHPEPGRFADVHTAEARGGNADDRHRMTVDENSAADRVVCAAESLPPVVIRKHHDGVLAGMHIVRRPDEATPLCAHTEHRKVRTRHHLGPNRFVLPARREIHRGRSAAEHTIEELSLFLQIATERIRQQVRVAELSGELAPSPVKKDEPLGIVDRQQAKQHLINQGEDSGVRTDAEREREHRGGGKARIASERAQAVADIARGVFEPWHASLITQRVHRLGATSGRHARDPHRLVRIVTATPRILGRQLHMQPKLFAPDRRLGDPGAAWPRCDESTREGRASSRLVVQQSVNDAGHLFPGLLFFSELPPAGCRERVIARLPVCIGSAPCPANEPALLEPHQRRV